MSIAVYRKKIQSSDPVWSDFNITAQTLREIAAYATSISGLLINNDAYPYNVYSSLNFSGGDMEECVYKWSTASNSAMVLFGPCKDGHTEYTNPETFVQFSEYSHGSGTLEHYLYLIVEDGRLIYMECRNVGNSDYLKSSGYVFFFYDDDGLRVALQGGGGGGALSILYGELKAYDDTTSRPTGTVILSGEHELSGSLPRRVFGNSVVGGTYKTPAGKALIYPVIQNDRAYKVDKIREYPVGIKCDDLGITGSANTAATYKRIQIGNQKYIHVGDQYWMPYDTYTESVINV